MEAAPTPAPAPHVLVVPFPAQGHALPLVDFVALLAARGLRLSVVTTPANLQLLSPLLAAHPAASTKGCGPGQFPAFMQAFAALREPILAWVRAQPDPVVAVVADIFCGWAQPLAREIGAAGIVFSPSGSGDEFSVAFPSIPGAPSYQWREMLLMYRNYMAGALEEQVGESVRQNFLWNVEEESWGFVFNSFRALEGRYLDQPLEDLGFRRVWAVGPVAPETDATGTRGAGGQEAVGAADLSAWLDAFPDGSVVYVCFGSQAVLTPAVAAALAEALERSAVPFLWVVGAESSGVALLRHAAVGWFVTHCGWNSTLEAVAAGVPMLAWPMTGDQFVNARLLVDEARVAVRACAGGEAARAVKEGGSSLADLEGLVQEIRKLG
ncbi:hypothetical protein BS78_06G260600 [Paspalum vaginatum]|nr:hypothetical protein BS78_06G260600 [Paspalum vaginatum]